MQQPHVFSVASLNAEVRQVLEQGFGSIWLVGEISNFAAPGSGHWYFTLKDERAQIKAAMFRNANQRVKIKPQHGMQVLVRAKLTVYEPRGDYQLIIEHMEDAGAGLLQQRYEQLKQKLQLAGLFDPALKQELPETIRKVGVITSPTGAAVRDILAVLRRRDPAIEVIIYPSSVQGQAATGELLHMLQRAVSRNEVDVLILARGGGSLEDLWCFNDEQLAYALHSCPLPTISAVGHETDFTICDYVADIRAPTPSAAAELISRDQRENLQRITHLQHRLNQLWLRQQRQLQQRLGYLQGRLQQQDPQRQLQQNGQRLDELQLRIEGAMKRMLEQRRRLQAHQQQRLLTIHPQRRVPVARQQLSQMKQRLQQAMITLVKEQRQRFRATSQQLHLVSPLQTIERGYAVVRTENGKVIRDPAELGDGQEFSVRVAKGEFTAKKSG